MILLGMRINYLVFLLPLVLALEFALIVGVSLILAPLNLRYRDLNQIWDITLQIGFYLCPIIYDTNLIPSRYLEMYSLNPMMRIIDSMRKILYYNTLPSFADFTIVLVSAALLLFFGCIIFRKLEPRFAEEI